MPWQGMRRLGGVGLVLLLVACQEAPLPDPEGPPLPSQIVEGFELVETSKGRKEYRLEAVRAYLYHTEDRIEVVEPRVLFFDEWGKVFSQLSAREGWVDLQSSNLTARGDVVVLTQDSTWLYTDSLVWDNRARLITTEGWVKIEHPKGTVIGWGLRSDPRLERIQILDSIRGSSPHEFGP